MIEIRHSTERGHTDYGWLKSQHTFSFGDYYNPEHMGFQALRVINEDRVQASKGFHTHAHNNMEILSYVVSGQLAHKDSMGNGRTIQTGELQAMSAGTGVTHSEFNPSSTEPVHFLQIWITPKEMNLIPSYAEWKPSQSPSNFRGLTLVASADARDGSLKLHQDVSVYLGQLEPGNIIKYDISKNRHVWLQLIEGELSVNNEQIGAGDGAAVSNESSVQLKAIIKSKFIFFEL